MSDVREYTVSARTAPVFGRVLANTRNHHLVVDGPVENGCPGEAPTPGELFLGAVACCAVELIQVFAQRDNVPLQNVSAEIHGMLDLANRVREDVMVFNAVRMRIALDGPDDAQAKALVDAFQGRCPLYGTLAVATPDLHVEWTTAR